MVALRRVKPYQALDLLVVALGITALLLTLPRWAADGCPLGWGLLSIPIVMLVSAFPLVLLRPGGDVEIGFDAAVLVALGVLLPHSQALVLWSIAGILSQVIASKRLWARMFNAGLVILVGGLALSIMTIIGGLGHTSAREFVAVLVGAAIYFTADWLITGLSLALESGERWHRLLFDRDLPVSMVWFLGISCIGYLAVLLPRSLPLWTLSLLTVPTIAMLVAARAVRRASEHQVRLSALFDAAKSAQGAESPSALLDSLTGHARRVLRSSHAAIRVAPPAEEEIGIRIGAEDGRWLVCAPRSAQPYDRADRRALAALATIVEESLVRMRMATEMTALATSDPLTGLANRTVFRQRIAGALEQRRPGTHVAVLFCDLDDFKPVNDRFGHEGGDVVLLTMANRLSRCVREGDTVARLGGDEFALLLANLDDPLEATRVAARVVAAAADPIYLAGRALPIGVSVGVAVDLAPSKTSKVQTRAKPVTPESIAAAASTLLGNADLAMYQAKAKGKSGYQLFAPAMRTERLSRIELLEQLRGAAGRGELLLEYQPVVDLASGVIDGFEALLRWQHPERGLLLPAAFIPLAEEAGLLTEIGDWLLPRAYADGCTLSAFAERQLNIGVNVSVRQLRDDHVLDLINGLPYHRHAPQLMLEVTESVFVEDEPYALSLLERLREHGVLLALDDFGIGYSSVAYLRNVPFTVCKIDRSFTGGLGQDPRADALCRAVLAMCESLTLPAVAEGIEDLDQVTMLRAAGCQFGQGFALGRPGDVYYARELLRNGRISLEPAAIPAPRAPRLARP
ncbi:MAG TPA: EAL domain-containing protein [Frankiaceae bacterium]|nr:EAL domain-containing protein [Frankiaceae bacterium]